MPPRVAAIHPHLAIEGGRVTIEGTQFPVDQARLPDVRIGDLPARVVYASPTAIATIVPPGLTESGRTTVRIEGIAGETPFIEVAAAFATDGTLFCGVRSGTIFRVNPDGRASAFASLPASVAAFHLAIGPDGAIYATAPTLSSYDVVYRIAAEGKVMTHAGGFGRPQGIAFDAAGRLHVVEALAGVSGLYRLPANREPELVLAGPGLVGVAFDPRGGIVVCSNETAYRLPRN